MSAGPGWQTVLHFVSLTNGFIMLDAKLWISFYHVNNDSFTGPLIIGAFENRPLAFWPAFPQRVPKKGHSAPPTPPPRQRRKFLDNGEEGSSSSMAPLFLSILVSFFSFRLSSVCDNDAQCSFNSRCQLYSLWEWGSI